MKDMIILLLGSVVFSVAILWGALALSEAGCAARWKDSGRKSEWSIKGDCRVEDKNGRLVPEKVIRDVQ